MYKTPMNSDHLVFLDMRNNRYIRNLVRMYQTTIAERERLKKEKLDDKPANWGECKEYFKLWVEDFFLSDKEVTRLIRDTVKRGPALLPLELLRLMRERLEEIDETNEI